MHASVWGHQQVVMTSMDPALEILPAPVGIDVRSPRHRQGMHAIFGAEDVRGIEAVLAARPRHDAVIVAVAAAVLVEQVAQPSLALLPVDATVLFLGEAAGVADSIRSKLMVFFLLSLVCSYSTAEFGRWLEITQRLQYTSCFGRPYLVVGLTASGANCDLSTSRGAESYP